MICHLFAGFVLYLNLLPVTIRIDMWSLFHVVYRYMYLGTLLSIITYYVYSPGVGNLQGVQRFQGFTEHLVPQHWWGIFCQVGHTREQREATHTSGKTRTALSGKGLKWEIYNIHAKTNICFQVVHIYIFVMNQYMRWNRNEILVYSETVIVNLNWSDHCKTFLYLLVHMVHL